MAGPDFKTVQGILARWAAGEKPAAAEQRLLETAWLADAPRARAFGLEPGNIQTRVERYGEVWVRSRLAIADLAAQLNLGALPLETLWYLWIPLACQLQSLRQGCDRPVVQGILGGQGTGKTTLGAVLTRLLAVMGDRAVSLSLDDLYKTYAERQALQQQDPRLRWRGPPGTHDVALGLRTLDALRASQFPVALPRFDKSACQGAGDRAQPESVAQADIVLFEGWFVGVRPLDSGSFDPAPFPIETEADRAFARAMNERLGEYLPLWERLDQLMVLLPQDYRFSVQWRQEAEQKMKAAGKSGMDDAEIQAFVHYFWRSLHPALFLEPLADRADHVNWIVEIDAHHRPTAVYRPGDRPHISSDSNARYHY